MSTCFEVKYCYVHKYLRHRIGILFIIRKDSIKTKPLPEDRQKLISPPLKVIVKPLNQCLVSAHKLNKKVSKINEKENPMVVIVEKYLNRF